MPPITLAGILIVLTVELLARPSYSLLPQPEKYVVAYVVSLPRFASNDGLWTRSRSPRLQSFIYPYLINYRFFFFFQLFFHRIKFQAWRGMRTIKVEKVEGELK